MGFYFDYHRLETVNKNPIHPIAFLKNHVNSKLFAKMGEGLVLFFRVASAQNVKKNPNPPERFHEKPLYSSWKDGFNSIHGSITPLKTGTI